MAFRMDLSKAPAPALDEESLDCKQFEIVLALEKGKPFDSKKVESVIKDFFASEALSSAAYFNVTIESVDVLFTSLKDYHPVVSFDVPKIHDHQVRPFLRLLQASLHAFLSRYSIPIYSMSGSVMIDDIVTTPEEPINPRIFNRGD